MTPARILVVEDDRVVARDIEQQLGRIGHAVAAVTARGEDAVRLALDLRPDLVLMDIRLEGDIDGIDAARQIRDHIYVPVVFLTAYADDETVRRASHTEPFGYLLKPFEDSQLRTVIEMALYKHAAERKLRESERRYVATLSSIGDAVIATDDQCRVTFMNPVAESLTGWSRKEAAGRPLIDVFRIFNEETREPVEDPATKVLRLGAVVGLANHTVLISRDGREVPIDDSGAPIIDDHGGIAGIVLVFRDISERRRIDEALRKAEADVMQAARLATMGELAVSIAHEVNQPLMAIVTNAEACLQWLAKDRPDLDEARKAAERIVRNAQHTGEVVKSIRALVQKSSPDMAHLDVNKAIDDILGLMRPEFRRHDVSLRTELNVGLAPILGDRVQLQQVVVNLVTNGIEAMSGVEQRPRLMRVSTQNDDDGNVLIAVEDSGIGLDPANADRIFEPLFTTKADGMGMGLSICRSIVEAHGGRLWASRNLPHGSIFLVTLPSSARSGSIDRSQ